MKKSLESLWVVFIAVGSSVSEPVFSKPFLRDESTSVNQAFHGWVLEAAAASEENDPQGQGLLVYVGLDEEKETAFQDEAGAEKSSEPLLHQKGSAQKKSKIGFWGGCFKRLGAMLSFNSAPQIDESSYCGTFGKKKKADPWVVLDSSAVPTHKEMKEKMAPALEWLARSTRERFGVSEDFLNLVRNSEHEGSLKKLQESVGTVERDCNSTYTLASLVRLGFFLLGCAFPTNELLMAIALLDAPRCHFLYLKVKEDLAVLRRAPEMVLYLQDPSLPKPINLEKPGQI